MSCRDADRDRRRSALAVVPAALRGGYAVLVLHGLFLMAGLDLAWWGPDLTPEQCFGAGVAYLVGWLYRRGDSD
jgi:hypothetical protein